MQIDRFRRHLIDIFGTHSVNTHTISGSNNQINMPSGRAELTKMDDSPGQKGRQLVSDVMGTGGELVRTPLTWIKEMQANWLLYLACGAIICLSILYFYCVISRYLNRKRNVHKDLLTLATIMEKRSPNPTPTEPNQRSGQQNP